MNIILIYFAIKYKGDWDKIYKALEQKEKVSLADMQELEQKVKESKWGITTIIDADYPKWLKQAYKPPFVFWYKGDKKVLQEKFICATGNIVDDQSLERIDEFLPEIEKSYKVITGGFKGIGDEVLKKADKGVLHILASGIDAAAPKHMKENDFILTEYPPRVKPHLDHFRNRNRLIAAFATSLVLFTSTKDGPINHLVTNFLNLGKDVYAFPGDGGEKDGNSELIKQGASLITSIKDITS